MMDHPNIARVFDAGETGDGLPYFVMEHVRGVRITEFCDEHRLPVADRLHLFIQVCHAIQHAHQNCIVHGDIKPSNILIAQHDGVPLPKVIDFGVAKATEARRPEKHPHVSLAQLVGTPAYMSPEQVELGGLDVDTRSDIYSLGVLLHELLTGRTPIDAPRFLQATLEEIRQLVRQHRNDPPSKRLGELPPERLQAIAAARRTSPRRLRQTLSGDLDCVVRKALEHDRRRRYETANAMAMDTQRYLQLEPLVAHPSGWFYRTSKLIRRNRGTFLATGAVAAALVVGTGTSTWLFLREREARQRAVAAEQQQARLRLEAETRGHITQAALLISQERFEEADDLVRALALEEPTMEGAAVFRSLGEWHAIHSRWRQAADRFEVLLRINQLEGSDVSSLDYLERGPTLVELGDFEAYEAFRQAAIRRFAGKQTPFADRIVKISLLHPADSDLLALLRPLVELAEEATREADVRGDAFVAAWRAMSLALYHYRSGRLAAAQTWCERSLSYHDGNAPRIATVRGILAMVHFRLGRPEASRAELAEARALLATYDDWPKDRGSPVHGFWFDWAFARLLLREASTLVELPRPPA
jgi:eukaryotic-like serine/threonine-protein kinase